MDTSMIHLVGESVAWLCFGVLVSVANGAAVCAVWKFITKSRSPKVAPGSPCRIWKVCVGGVTKTGTASVRRAMHGGNGKGI